MTLARGVGPIHWLAPPLGPQHKGAGGGGVERDPDRQTDRQRVAGRSPAHSACPPTSPVQPPLKIEPHFAERFSDDTHQVPINSSKWRFQIDYFECKT